MVETIPERIVRQNDDLPQVADETLEVIKVIPSERHSKRTEEQIVDAPVPHVELAEFPGSSWSKASGTASTAAKSTDEVRPPGCSATQIVHVPVPHVVKEIPEMIKDVPQERISERTAKQRVDMTRPLVALRDRGCASCCCCCCHTVLRLGDTKARERKRERVRKRERESVCVCVSVRESECQGVRVSE